MPKARRRRKPRAGETPPPTGGSPPPRGTPVRRRRDRSASSEEVLPLSAPYLLDDLADLLRPFPRSDQEGVGSIDDDDPLEPDDGDRAMGAEHDAARATHEDL